MTDFQRYARWSIFALNLVGDPEMRIHTRALLMPCLDFLATVRIDRPYIVHVSHDSMPASRAVVTASSGEWQAQAITDHQGDATLDLRGAPVGRMTLTVTHPNLVPASGSAQIIGPAWRDAEILGVDSAHAGVQARARWDDVEHVVGISPCARASVLPLLTSALATQRTLRLYIVDEPAGAVVEGASLR
jgi:hypothetical protein